MTHPDLSIGGWLAARVARSPKRRAITFEGTTRTYAELFDRANRLATALAERGVSAGDRVAFLGQNQPAVVETWVAVNRLGAIFLPLNFRLAGPELQFILSDADVSALIADQAFQQTIDGIREEIPTSTFVCVDGPADGWDGYEDALSAAEPLAETAPSDPDATAILMYTSGTTGAPKGVILTNANLFWNNVNLQHLYDVSQDDVTLAVAPMFHIAGLNVTIPTTLIKGGEVIIHRAFDPNAVIEEIERSKVTTTFAVPAMLNALAQLPTFADADLSSLRVVIGGGAPVPEPLLRTYAERGIGVLQGYGLTETSPAAIFLVAEFALAKLGSAGQPPLFVDVKLVNHEGTEVLGNGERGEICLRGPNVSRRYWNRPDATQSAHDPDGWFHTGDVGVRDEDGFYSIVDRVKDMVITGGENVFPAEVENVIFDHPAVADVAVLGLPDEKWGEAVTAAVVLKPGAELTLEELRAFCSDHLARYKVPGRLHILPELPRNAGGKVVKFKLKDELS